MSGIQVGQVYARHATPTDEGLVCVVAGRRTPTSWNLRWYLLSQPGHESWVTSWHDHEIVEKLRLIEPESE